MTERVDFEGGYYIGELKNGVFNGKGTLYTKEHVTTGNWVDGNIEGEGIRVYANGDRYEGMFRNGRMNGFGTLTHPDGTCYQGAFIDDDVADTDWDDVPSEIEIAEILRELEKI